ncbi:hypothetical protein AMATHDRAFT_4788 [Amanita thiersii Skay4041]|uniref:Uncharacterized protein n=1 Tax=Amanita thiersii Skay4041 TaxID=703135 RepID=A0A2A9NEZ3_9AGAR|nr:hypothetical protein AMATHDRAFT_4788 [Amanita thiersii Skay4041]
MPSGVRPRPPFRLLDSPPPAPRHQRTWSTMLTLDSAMTDNDETDTEGATMTKDTDRQRIAIWADGSKVFLSLSPITLTLGIAIFAMSEKSSPREYLYTVESIISELMKAYPRDNNNSSASDASASFCGQTYFWTFVLIVANTSCSALSHFQCTELQNAIVNHTPKDWLQHKCHSRYIRCYMWLTPMFLKAGSLSLGATFPLLFVVHGILLARDNFISLRGLIATFVIMAVLCVFALFSMMPYELGSSFCTVHRLTAFYAEPLRETGKSQGMQQLNSFPFQQNPFIRPEQGLDIFLH